MVSNQLLIKERVKQDFKDFKVRSFISYWLQNIAISLYNRYVLKDHFLERSYYAGFENLEFHQILDAIFKNDSFSQVLKLKAQILPFNKQFKTNEELKEFLVNSRNEFSHSFDYIEENFKDKKIVNYNIENINEFIEKLEMVLSLFLTKKQFLEFKSMYNSYKFKMGLDIEKIEEFIEVIDKNEKIKKIDFPFYGFSLTEKIYQYLQSHEMNQKISEVQEYDLLLTFLEELWEDSSYIKILKENNTKENLKRFKGNLSFKKNEDLPNIVLSKYVLLLLIAYGVHKKEKDFDSFIDTFIFEFINMEEKKKKKNKTSNEILNSRIKYIEERLSKIKEYSFQELKKIAIKGINRYVIVYSSNPLETRHNNQKILASLYASGDIDEFKIYVKELLNKYKIDNKFINNILNGHDNFKFLLIKLVEFLYRNIIMCNNRYIQMKLLKIPQNPNSQKNKNHFIGIKPSMAYKHLFKTTGFINGDYVFSIIKKHNKIEQMMLKALKIISDFKESNYPPFIQLLSQCYHMYLGRKGKVSVEKLYRELNNDEIIKKRAFANFLATSNKLFDKEDIDTINELIKINEFNNLMEYYKNETTSNSKDYIFTMSVLMEYEYRNEIEEYRNIIFHLRKKDLLKLNADQMSKIVDNLNPKKYEYYKKYDKNKNLLKLRVKNKQIKK